MPAPEVIINEAIIAQAAALAATGATTQQIATQLGMSKYHAKKVMSYPEFKKQVKAIGDEAVNNAKQIIRSQTSDLANEVARVLKARLEENDLEAVKVALKVIGFEQEEQNRGDTNIVVQLPGSVEKHVESEFAVIGETQDEHSN